MDEELITLIGAVTIASTEEVWFGGRRVWAGDAGAPSGPGHPLQAALAHRLYLSGYCHRVQVPCPPDPAPPDPDPDFAAALAATAGNRPALVPGWQVVGPGPGGTTLLERDGRVVMAQPGAFLLPERAGLAPGPGMQATLYQPPASAHLQPGAVFVFGATPADAVADARTVRFYWHIAAGGAVRLLEGLVAALDRWGVPFRIKAWSTPAAYSRRDGAILYVPTRHYALVAEQVARAYGQVQPALEPDVPLFTRRLAPGLALADDPGPGESFGQHRCRLVAEALWQAPGLTEPAARLAAVRARFVAAGLDPAAPHLHPPNREEYPWPP
jgi:hypothetical protein